MFLFGLAQDTIVACLGTAHGTSLLLQAIKRQGDSLVVPRLNVEDAPLAEYYGTMVDLARPGNTLLVPFQGPVRV